VLRGNDKPYRTRLTLEGLTQPPEESGLVDSNSELNKKCPQSQQNIPTITIGHHEKIRT
jgi:hypothetical protein